MRSAFRIFICLSVLFLPVAVDAQEVREIVFPVQGEYSFSDSYGDPRSGGRVHEGVDIFADKMTPLIAAVDGRVTYIADPEPSWGYAVFITDRDGYQYRYIHMNNDTPGTDDGMGGALYAYPPTIYRGSTITAGQLVGWVGDSGNAESTVSHLHFEIRTPDREPINPYLSLLQAEQPGAFNPMVIQSSATSITTDRGLAVNPAAACEADTLIKILSSDAVYYCGADGKRYVFPNLNTYRTWYDDFNEVVEISPEQLAAIPLGGNVTYKPGSRMIKIQTDPKVYAVDRGGVLRWVTSDQIAQSMYGSSWANQIDDLSDAFFINYRLGQPITVTLQ